MAEIVNLRTARKRKERAAREKAAQESRIRHGRTRAERVIGEASRDKEDAAHAAHLREKPDGNHEP